jgi:hypothetical protein
MTIAYQALRVAGRFACVLASVVSCRQIVDFDEPPPSSELDDLFATKPPYATAPRCTACIAKKCPDEDAACQEDPFCQKWLVDARELQGPPIAAIDFQHETSEPQWDFARGEVETDVTVAQTKFSKCVSEQCPADCELGRDFSCVGKYAWHANSPDKTEVRVRLFGAFDNLRIRACVRQHADDCEPPMGDARVPPGGLATVSVDLALAPPEAVLSEFYGSLLVEHGPDFHGTDDFMPAQIDTTGPFCDKDVLPLFALTKSLVARVAEQTHIPDDQSRGLLQVYPFDCTQARLAYGVTVEVWTWDDGESRYLPCDHCRFYYPNETGFPDPSRKAFSLGTFVPASARADPGDVMLIMRDATTRVPLSVLRPLTVRKGHVHQVYMFPASTAELADIPDGVR